MGNHNISKSEPNYLSFSIYNELKDLYKKEDTVIASKNSM